MARDRSLTVTLKGNVSDYVASMQSSTDTADIVNVVVCPWQEPRPDGAAEDFVPKGGYGTAIDTTSSTSVLSPVGRRVRKYSGDTSVIASQSHADDAASSQLVNQRDLQASVSLTAISDPRLDVNVVAAVAHPDLGVDDLFRVTGVTHALPSAPVQVRLGASAKTLAARMRGIRKPEGRTTREIVTSVDPLQSRSVHEPEGAVAAVEFTDAIKGVAVGDLILVKSEGLSMRTAVGYVGGIPLSKRFAGEKAATIGGSDVAVGGALTVQARVGSSGSYATFSQSSAGTIRADLPAPASGASTTHTHTLPNVTLPTRTASAVNESVTHGGFDQPLRVVVNDMQADFDALRNSLQANLTTNDQTSGPVG